MMERLSRAGRRKVMHAVLRNAWRKDKSLRLTVGDVAKRMGMKSSSKLKKLLIEMSDEGMEICQVNINGVDRFYFKPYEQMSLLDRPITINGVTKTWREDYPAWVGLKS